MHATTKHLIGYSADGSVQQSQLTQRSIQTDTSWKPELIRAQGTQVPHMLGQTITVDSQHLSGPLGALDRLLPHHLVCWVLASIGSHGYGGYEIDPGENA